MQINSRALTGKRILVTRPVQQAEALCDLIRRSGGNPVMFPVIEIEPLSAGPTAREQLAAAALVIFVSRNAVQQFCLQFPKSITTIAAVPVFAMGDGTRDSLQRNGIDQVLCADTGIGSEALLALPQLDQAAVQGKSVLIIKGEGGRELLQQTLQQRGADTSCLELYRRKLPETNPARFTTIWHQNRPDVMIFTSAEGIDNFSSMIPSDELPGLLTTPVLVWGERVAAAAQATGFNRVSYAQAADDYALLQALYKLYEAEH
ncbi:MAG: uroporphyrinogen-III synthase [Gammaproteobacteria bacterium]